jgi:hypothetical protein
VREQRYDPEIDDTATFEDIKLALTWRPEMAQIYRLTLPSVAGQTPQVVREIPDSAVYFVGLSEEGSQSVLAVGQGEILEYYNYSASEVPIPPYAREEGCVIEYRDPRLASARDSRDRIPAAGACPPLFTADWTGTISPYRAARP